MAFKHYKRTKCWFDKRRKCLHQDQPLDIELCGKCEIGRKLGIAYKPLTLELIDELMAKRSFRKWQF